MQAIAEQSRIVRLPLNQVGAVSKINQVTAKFVQEHNRRPSADELATLTGIDADKIQKSLNADSHQMSIDAPFSDDDDNSMSDMLSSGDDSRTDRQVDYESMQNDMEGVLKSVLKDRELKIVKDCFGIGGPEKGLEEIGEEMGLTRERVRQIREKSIMKIRQSGNAKLLMKYLG
jgi:RNA polymerase primary sigma factor